MHGTGRLKALGYAIRHVIGDEDLAFPRKKGRRVEEVEAELEISADLQSLLESGLEHTEAVQLIMARVGQGRFRRALFEHWQGRCALSGIDQIEVLRASHIRRWADCTSKEDRLSANNGLLLRADLDALFESGLITFDNHGKLLVSLNLPIKARRHFGVKPGQRLTQVPSPEQAAHLAWHREHRFQGADA